MKLVRKHSHISHQKPFLEVCYKFRVGFQTKLDCAEHVTNKHGMPILDMEEDEIDLTLPTVSSFSGCVIYYEFQPGEKSLDRMENMFRKRDKESRIIQKHTKKFSLKLQVRVKMTLQKPLEE